MVRALGYLSQCNVMPSEPSVLPIVHVTKYHSLLFEPRINFMNTLNKGCSFTPSVYFVFPPCALIFRSWYTSGSGYLICEVLLPFSTWETTQNTI